MEKKTNPTKQRGKQDAFFSHILHQHGIKKKRNEDGVTWHGIGMACSGATRNGKHRQAPETDNPSPERKKEEKKSTMNLLFCSHAHP